MLGVLFKEFEMPRPGVPSLDQLAVFLTVVETGSFAAAGRRLGRATSAVSYAIANLASDRSRKAVTDSTRSGLRPIPLARPPEFVICPLMREIRAFRYFWPMGKGWLEKVGPQRSLLSGFSLECCFRAEGTGCTLAHPKIVASICARQEDVACQK